MTNELWGSQITKLGAKSHFPKCFTRADCRVAQEHQKAMGSSPPSC